MCMSKMTNYDPESNSDPKMTNFDSKMSDFDPKSLFEMAVFGVKSPKKAFR